MVLFPIAFIWVAVVLVWVIRRSSVEPESPPPEPRRFRPRGPRGGPGPHESSRAERPKRTEAHR